MGRIFHFGLAVLLMVVGMTTAALAQARHALVIGNSAYVSAPALKTPAADATIVAETLRAAGYDVTELHDLAQDAIGPALRDFLDKLVAGGPDGAAFVYYSGHGAQSEGENYLVPVDAAIKTDADIPNEAFRLNDLLDELKATPLAARIVILDAARDPKFGSAAGKPVAKGLALGPAIPGMMLAYSAAPGMLSTDGDGDYSLFTGALVTAMRQPGLDMEQILKATRLAVNKATNGAQTPWMTSDLDVDVVLFAPPPSTPAPQAMPDGSAIPSKDEQPVTLESLGKLSPEQAYAAAVEEDTLDAYQSFVQKYPKYELAPQVWDIIASRREAVLWQRTLAQNTSRAYWNYLKRYPNGPHVTEAQDQLDDLAASRTPPANYVVVPEPLPPDYYDEAVGLYEVYPEGYDAPPSVFDILAPLFIPRPPQRLFIDRRRDLLPGRIPRIVGNPVQSFTSRTNTNRTNTNRTNTNRTNTNRTNTNRTNTSQTNTNRTKSGFVSPTTGSPTTRNTKRSIDQGSPVGQGGRTPTKKKSGLTIRPTGTPTTGRPTTPGSATGRPTTPGSATGRPTIPPSTGTRPTSHRRPRAQPHRAQLPAGQITPGSATGRRRFLRLPVRGRQSHRRPRAQPRQAQLPAGQRFRVPQQAGRLCRRARPRPAQPPPDRPRLGQHHQCELRRRRAPACRLYPAARL